MFIAQPFPALLLPVFTMLVILGVARILRRRTLCHADETSKPLIVFVGWSAARMRAAGRLAAPVVLVTLLVGIAEPKIRLSHQPLEVIAAVDCRLIATSRGAHMSVAAGIRTITRSLPNASHGITSSGTKQVRWTAPTSLAGVRAVVREGCDDGSGAPSSALSELTLLDPLRQFDDWSVRRAMILLLDPTTGIPDLEDAVAEVRRLKVIVVVVQVGGEWRTDLEPLLSVGVPSYVVPRLGQVPNSMREVVEAIGANSFTIRKPFFLLSFVMIVLIMLYEGSLVHLAVAPIRSLVVRSLLLARFRSIALSDRRRILPSL